MANRTEEFYNSEYWKEVRISILNRDNSKCMICESKEDLHIHHKDYSFKEYTEKENMQKLISLCGECHISFHQSKRASENRINVECNLVEKNEKIGIIGMNVITNTSLTYGEKILLAYYSCFVEGANSGSNHLFFDKEVAKQMNMGIENIRRLKSGLSKKGFLKTIKQGYTRKYYYLIGKSAVEEYQAKKDNRNGRDVKPSI